MTVTTPEDRIHISGGFKPAAATFRAPGAPHFGQSFTDRLTPDRIVGIVLVVLLHIGIIYALATALSRKSMEFVPPPIETKILEQVKQDKAEPPPPPPKFQPPPPPFVPPPEIQIATPEPATSTAIQVHTDKVAPPAPPAPVETILPREDPNHPNLTSEDDYPPFAKRNGIEGVTMLEILIDAEGRVIDAKVAKSSKSSELDQQALVVVRRFRYLPGTKNGQAAPVWMPQQIIWHLDG